VDSTSPVGIERGARSLVDRHAPERAQRLLALTLEVNRFMLTEPTPEAATVAAMRAVCTAQGWEAGTYWRLDETEGVLRVHAGWSLDDARIRRALRKALTMACGPGVGLAGEVLCTGETLWIPDLRTDARVLRPRLTDEAGWAAALLVPVSAMGRVVGVLDFNAPSIPEPDEGLLEVLQLFAQQIGERFVRAGTEARLRDRVEHSNPLEIRIPSPVGQVMRVADSVSVHRTFAADFTSLCHVVGFLPIETRRPVHCRRPAVGSNR
jgi:GAF domain-containing protein